MQKCSRYQETNNFRRVIYHDQGGFITGIQGWFYIHKSIKAAQRNKTKGKNPFVSVGTQRLFHKMLGLLLIKAFNGLVTEGTHKRTLSTKPTVHIPLQGKELKAFPPRPGTKQGHPLSLVFLRVALEVLA